ncbi:Ankyrin repeat domain-containing protein 39 [Symbiodinium microadriaticum]|uniref:Ankyrin repeat domain-containing protein 39 n=1 Tax=Symbiodinium microadriaticum TaxID=2951 RepID=A0A1Q9EXF1_SYMMI|nr:Ankyrin repeat domain-containing protein 39 [Symbiodinium microadriaticum]CAE7208731.1 Ank2 [Symbiodinium sp. KB8]
MLYIWSVSGDQLAAMPSADVEDVRTVKAELYRLHGWSRFRQRLLHDGCVLENTASLDGRVDVQMLLVDFASTSWHQADSLTKAVTSGNVGLVAEILDRPQNPNFVDTQGRKPLGLALRGGHIGIAQLLLEAGAGKDFIGQWRQEAFEEAIMRGQTEVVQLLLEVGAHKSWVTQNRDMLPFAVQCGQTDIVTLLLAAGFKEAMIKALLFTIIQNRVDMLRLLLDAGVQRRDLRIACQAASNEQKHDIVQVLVEAGASPPVAATAPRLDTESFHAAARAIALRGGHTAQTADAIRELFYSSLQNSPPPPPAIPPPPSLSPPLPPVPSFRPPPPPPTSTLPQPDTAAPKMPTCHRGFHDCGCFGILALGSRAG